MSEPSYFSRYPTIRFERDADGVLVMSLHSNGGPLTFTAADHEAYVDAFYEVGRDRANKVVILTGAGGDFIPASTSARSATSRIPTSGRRSMMRAPSCSRMLPTFACP